MVSHGLTLSVRSAYPSESRRSIFDKVIKIHFGRKIEIELKLDDIT